MITRWLDALWNVFDVKGRRALALAAAQQAAEEAERGRQLAEAAKHEQLLELVEMVLTKSHDASKGQTEALIELAKGIQSHGQALNTWFETFKHYQADGDTHTVRPAEEANEAEQREIEELRAKGYPVGESPEAVGSFLSQLFGSNTH